MTINELNKYRYIKNNIKHLQEKIDVVNSQIITASKISDTKVIRSHTNADNTGDIAVKLAELKEELLGECAKLIEKDIEINKFIGNIDDEEIKYIIRERFLNFKSWYDISAEMDCDRTTPRKKLKKYLNERSKIYE